MKFRVGVISGDGIGPEIVKEAKKVLEDVGLQLELKESEGSSIDTITNQLPKAGIKTKQGTSVVVKNQ